MRACPDCAGPMEKVAGVINEPVFTREGRIGRSSRPAVFFACTRCEHCEEVPGGRQATS